MTHPDWAGWRFAGQDLISPDRLRVRADVLRHLIHMHHVRQHFERVGLKAQAEASRRRQQERHRQRVRVVVVQLDEWKARQGLLAG